MKLILHQFDLPLRHPFTISRGSTSVQKTLIVELRDAGFSGYGEATANRYYGMTVDKIAAALESATTQIENFDLKDPAEMWAALDPLLCHNRFAQCALDEAAHDLWGKLRGQPVYQLWGLSPDMEELPVSNYTIGIDETEVMLAKLREFADWPIFKIKLGTPRDIEIVRELRKHTDAVFRVDANCAWTAEETIRNANEMLPLGVEFIEQPLPADRWDEMRRVRGESPLLLIADESCLVEGDVDRCADVFHGINIKLVKCGGLTPGRRMISRARELGLKVMVGCMTESTVGISAIAQLLPLLDYVDMDGAALLARDIATGVTVERGVCRYAEENGCGVWLLNPLPSPGP